jgi:hypothetical protein
LPRIWTDCDRRQPQFRDETLRELWTDSDSDHGSDIRRMLTVSVSDSGGVNAGGERVPITTRLGLSKKALPTKITTTTIRT